jgi:hypothetical protein
MYVLELEIEADLRDVVSGAGVHVEPAHLVRDRVFKAHGALVILRGNLRSKTHPRPPLSIRSQIGNE